MACDRCGSEQFTRAGHDRQDRQRYRCRAWGRRLTERLGSAFRGYRFPDEAHRTQCIALLAGELDQPMVEAMDRVESSHRWTADAIDRAAARYWNP